MQNRIKNIVLIPLFFILVACSQENGSSDLKQYIANLKKEVAKTENLLEQYQLRKPTTYTTEPTRSAFPQQNVVTNSAQMGQSPLERYPLDALNLLGTIQDQDQYSAVISAPDGKVYQVAVGSYIGNQHGKIIAINESQVSVEEPPSLEAGTLTGRTVNLRLKDQ